MPKFIDLKGMKFGRWLVIKRGENGKGKKARWHCVCDCGNARTVKGSSLTAGTSQSCGCLSRELTGKKFFKHGYARRGKLTRAYEVWLNMRNRCNNSNHPSYKNYGGRGISVYIRWNNFENFLKDMGEPPDGLEIDRIDNDGNYEPGNCRWATSKQQKTNNRKPKLTKLKVQVIKKLLTESSLTLRAIADIFNVTDVHIGHIKSNRAWKNVQYRSI